MTNCKTNFRMLLAVTIVAMGAFCTVDVQRAQADLVAPTNLVGNIYWSPTVRSEAFALVTAGDFGTANGDGWDTFGNTNGDNTLAQTDFAGLIYQGTSQTFDTATVTMGNQFDASGNGWHTAPNIYVLKNDVDTNQSKPETDANWSQIAGATLVGGVFNPGAGGNVTFDLTGVAAGDRTGFGWAVGGVPGGGGEGRAFVSVTELTATGSAAVPEPSTAALAALGLLGLSTFARRRRQRSRR